MESSLRIDWKEKTAKFNWPLFTVTAKTKSDFREMMKNRNLDSPFLQTEVNGMSLTLWVDFDFAALSHVKTMIDLENGPFSLVADLDQEGTRRFVESLVGQAIVELLPQIHQMLIKDIKEK